MTKRLKFQALDNLEIDDYYKKNPKFGGVYAKDGCPKRMTKSAYIFNLENQDQDGSHWIAAVKTKKAVVYIDPFGIVPPPDIIQFLKTSKKPLVYNTIQFQDLDSVLCGYYCIYFIDKMLSGSQFTTLMAGFSNNTKDNDCIIRHYFDHHKLIDTDGKLIHGAGIIDVLRSIPQRIAGFIKGPRAGAPPVIRRALSDFGNQFIVRMRVCRTPIHGMVDRILNLISTGEYAKQKAKLRYDQIFHLFLVLELQNGKVFRLEKNATVNFGTFHGTPSGLLVPLTKRITLAEFLNKPAEKIGAKFWQYDTVNNCQYFVKTLLDVAGLNSLELNSYVVQDAKAIFSTSPQYVPLFTNAIANLGARADILVQGQGL